jgi:hypothetical protein
MPPLTLTDFRRMSPTQPDNERRQEHLLNSSEHSFPVLPTLGFLEIEQKPNDEETALAPGSNGLPERRIGRWNYTIVPWED